MVCACDIATQTGSSCPVVSVLPASHAACLGIATVAKFPQCHLPKIAVQTAESLELLQTVAAIHLPNQTACV